MRKNCLGLDPRVTQQLKLIGQNLPIFTVSVFGAVVLYYAGYFSWTLGFSVPPIDAQDLSLSSVALAGVLLAGYNIWISLNAGNGFGWLFRLAIILVFLLVSLSPVFKEMLDIGFDNHKFDFGFLFSRLALTVVGALGVALYWWFQKKSELLSFQEITFFLFLGAIFILTFGFQAFLSDLKESKYSTVKLQDTKFDIYVLRVMSSNIVAFDDQTCQLVLLNRSAVSSVSFKTNDTLKKSANANLLDCLFK
jgi:hypothetical protein